MARKKNTRPVSQNSQTKSQVLGNKKQKPPITRVDPTTVPAMLKKFDRWIGWIWQWNQKANGGKGKWNKPPKDVRSGGSASGTDSSTWCSFDDAMAGLKAGRVDGIGFVLGEFEKGKHFIGIDLDDCRNNVTGKLNDLAMEIVEKADTYTEVSPSGTGVKLICIGSPLPGRKTSNSKHTIEIYAKGRYFTITGNRIKGNQKGIEVRSPQLKKIYELHFGNEKRSASNRKLASQSTKCDVPPKAFQAIIGIQPTHDEADGSERLIRVAKQVVRFDLSDEIALRVIRAYESVYPFPRKYSDDEVIQRIRDAEGRSKRGSAKNKALRQPAYIPFPTHVLPKPLRDLAESGAKAIGCDAAFIAAPALVVCAAAIGDTREVQLKRSWKEPAIVGSAIVSPSGSGKSPGLTLALAPIYRLQEAALAEFKAQMEEYQAELEEYNDLIKASPDKRPEKPTKPVAKRYVVNDVTMEALGPLLEQSPRGVLLARDELSGWIASFDRYVRGGGKTSADAAHWLAIHGGRPTIIDRKTGDKQTIHLSSPRVSVTGGIQPGILRKAMGEEHRENGLAARILGIYPPVRPKEWTDAEVPAEVEDAYSRTVELLYELTREKNDRDEWVPLAIHLSQGAKNLFTSFYNSHSQEAAEEEEEIAAAFWKLEGFAARLALILHCIRRAIGETDSFKIDEVSMRNALELVTWFKQEARRVYSMIHADDDEIAQQRLVDFVTIRGGAVTVREVQAGHRRFRTSADAEEALNELVAAGLGTWKVIKSSAKGGQPKREFVLNSANGSK